MENVENAKTEEANKDPDNKASIEDKINLPNGEAKIVDVPKIEKVEKKKVNYLEKIKVENWKNIILE